MSDTKEVAPEVRRAISILRGARLIPRADLTGADLTGANLTGADLARADLAGADLRGAYLADATRRVGNAPIPGWTVRPAYDGASYGYLAREGQP